MTNVQTGSVTSTDGRTIGYRQLGHGPGVVVLHGTMSSGHSHLQLAQALADEFTVYLPDRRGRGLSGSYDGPSGGPYDLRRDIDDLDALLTATGAHRVAGISSGGIICLHAALTLPAIHRAAIYEPPLFPEPEVPSAVLARFDRELARGDTAAALVTAMKGAQMGPRIFTVLPRWLLRRLTAMAMAADDKKASGEDVPMRLLAPTVHDDFALIAETSRPLDDLAAMPAEVLLLGGSKSQAYVRAALDALERVLPRVRRVEFPGLDHSATLNTDQGGQPGVVAQELRRYLAPDRSGQISGQISG